MSNMQQQDAAPEQGNAAAPAGRGLRRATASRYGVAVASCEVPKEKQRLRREQVVRSSPGTVSSMTEGAHVPLTRQSVMDD